MSFEHEAEESWTAFDAALRRIERAGPDPSLRNRCLPPEWAAPPATKGRVLVVDDEPNIRRLVVHHLLEGGYETVEAENGRHALSAVRTLLPDLVILDVMMPGMDGLEVLGRLKEDPRTTELPVIMLTARSTDDQIRHGWYSGVEWYVTKPFLPAELRMLVDRFFAVLGTPENPPPLRRWHK